MKFLNKLFPGKQRLITTYTEFWEWFRENEQVLFRALKSHKNVEKDFINVVHPKLRELREGYFLLAGMETDEMAELIVTADGSVREFIFVEELIDVAPELPNWKFTAHKTEMDAENAGIRLGEFNFDQDHLAFHANEHPDYPDDIDITIVCKNLDSNNQREVDIGVSLYLTVILGELNMATKVDNVEIVGPASTKGKPVPMVKLKDFINWREKEFLEKYEGRRHDTENDAYATLEFTDSEERVIIATLNTTLLNWDAKASHPWRMDVVIPYDCPSHEGMPDSKTYQEMNNLEDEIMALLRDEDGYLNVGRETGANQRVIFFACFEFRTPSKIMDGIKKKYDSQRKSKLRFEIFKDKYWRSLEVYAKAV